MLQANLLRRFLDYDECSRARAHPGALSMSLTRNTEELVARGYERIFPLFMRVSRLFLILCYQLATSP